MLAGSFAAVLTYSASELSSRAQEAVGGLLSVLAVGLVTGMVFWMRRTAAGLSAQLRGEVQRAVAIGAGALTVTAFLAVGREGLETTLFLWAAVRASGSTVAPLVGAGLGLAAAVALCWLLYRRAVRLNVGAFFNRTAVALIVIAAGVLSYGLGDLQDAGVLPGQHWIAFDLTGHVDPGSWWVSVLTGVTELTPKMTVLQVGRLGHLPGRGHSGVHPRRAFRHRRPQAAPLAPARPRPLRRRSGRLRPRRLARRRPAGSGWPRSGPGGSRGAGRGAGGGGRHRDRGPPGGSANAATAVTVTQDGCAGRLEVRPGPEPRRSPWPTRPERPARSTWSTRAAQWWPRSRRSAPRRRRT